MEFPHVARKIWPANMAMNPLFWAPLTASEYYRTGESEETWVIVNPLCCRSFRP